MTDNMTEIIQDNDFGARLRRKAQFVNYALQRILDAQDIHKDLKEAIAYTLGAPGKRTRSVIVLWCSELLSGKVNHDSEMAAAAIEMIHTYSLIHDDLPAMDDDDVRRGQPTCHKAFDEGTAILAGDALLTLAFEILSREIHPPTLAVKLIAQLAMDAGPSGMIGGQMADLKTTGENANMQILEFIHINKTAKLFRCAAAMGGLCGGASKKQLDWLCEYGLKLGLCFQIADDILDVSQTSEQLGKTAGKDAKSLKCTYPSVVGVEKARALQKKLTDEAVAVLEPFGQKADNLRELAYALLERTK
jgi:geranylgeranyl diphosphate synthase, type II